MAQNSMHILERRELGHRKRGKCMCKLESCRVVGKTDRAANFFVQRTIDSWAERPSLHGLVGATTTGGLANVLTLSEGSEICSSVISSLAD